MLSSLLDTDILSEILKQKNTEVVRKASGYLQAHLRFQFSAITRYEIMRGLKAKSATSQLNRFDTFCRQSYVLPVTDAICDRAADLWVTSRAIGRAQKDADILIAATALHHGLALVTGNVSDFSWIIGLSLDDWRVP